jgi:hypothetical protein
MYFKVLFLSSCGVYMTYMCDPSYEIKVGHDKSLWSCLLMLHVLNSLLNVWYNEYIQVEVEF